MSVLSLVLFTYDSSATHCTNTIMKFADDTIVFRLISDNDEVATREQVQHLTERCSSNNLDLNILKTKEMITDLQEVHCALCTCLDLSQPNMVDQHCTLTEEGLAKTPEEVEALPLPTTADHQLPAVC